MTEKESSTSARPLTPWRMILAGMRYSWRISAAVALGVATATAVIVGALLVGDSMRGSLRGLTIQRLGNTVSIVAPGGFFTSDGITGPDIQPVPMVLFASGVVEARSLDKGIRRAGNVQIIGSDDNFWDLDTSGTRPSRLPDQNGIVMNASAAAELAVSIGDQVTLRLPTEQAVPADSPLGRRDIQSEGLPRMEVIDIIPDRGLGRFAITPSQASPQNIYVSRRTIGEALQREGQANLLLFDRQVSSGDLKIDLDDLGLSLRRIKREFSPPNAANESSRPQVIYDYYSLTSDRLLLPEVAVERISEALSAEKVQSVTTYLANAIERLDASGNVVASVPYSTITAIDSSPSLPLRYSLPEQKIPQAAVPLVLNDWTAQQLGASEGTPVRVAYFEPEVENGKEIERFFDAVVTAVVPITEPAEPFRRSRDAVFDQPPTVYNDPDLTPIVPGVTDQDSIGDWDLPFRLERKINKQDDDYWNDYRLTPKAFLPLAEGRRLFGSRFGQTTSLRISADAAADEQALRAKMIDALTPVVGELGWSIRPIRNQQLAASRGTTPFDGLFLALSSFVILSAVLLIAMLFRLGLVERTRQFGILLAVGWTPRRVTMITLGEGLLVASIGVLIGVAAGILYAIIAIWGLRSWWVGAVTVPFLTFHWTPRSLLIGAVLGWLVSAVTLAVTVRWLMKVDAQSLLSQRDLDTAVGRTSGRSKLPLAAGAMAVVAVLVAAFGATSGGQTAAGGFIGGGMMLLAAALIAIYQRLRCPRRMTTGLRHPAVTQVDKELSNRSTSGYTLGRMAARNATRQPLRSALTIGLMASAAFLIIAIAAFRLQPTEQGTGGFRLLGQSAQPLYRDLRDSQVQAELFGPDVDQLSSATFAPIRMRVGQDASCNNLYQATQPTVLGVPASFALLMKPGSGTMAGFEWAAAETQDPSPWDLLADAAAGTQADPIPVVIDQNTAMWSLQMVGGIGEVREFEYQAGKPIYFKVVGLLSNSVLQGRLMIGETNFERTFPDINGYRFFLIGCDPDQSKSLTAVLENRLSDVGMDISDANEVLAGMMAVQNTYLRTFQSLGALGLLLGTIGLAVAQLRSVLDRRQELAVMRAIGFTRRRLATVVMSETASLLLAGIGCGVVCAALAVLPYSIVSGLNPPIAEPLLTVLGIVVFGMLAGLVAVRRISRMPLVESLRSE